MKAAIGTLTLAVTLLMPSSVPAGFLDGLVGDVVQSAVGAAMKKGDKAQDNTQITDNPDGDDPYLPHKYLKKRGAPKAKPIGTIPNESDRTGISNETIYQTEAFAAAKPSTSTAKTEGMAALIKRIKALGKKDRKPHYTYINLVRHDGEGGQEWYMTTEPVETEALIEILAEPSLDWEYLDLVLVGEDFKLGDTPITGWKGHFRVVWEPQDMPDGGRSYLLTPAELHQLVRQTTGTSPSYSRPKLAKKPFETGQERDEEASRYRKN